MAVIEVYLNRKGEWRWRHKDGKPSKAFETRREAIDAASAEAGVEPLFNRDGDRVGSTDPHTSVVLLRADGSVHGELYAPRSSKQAQRVDLTPAGESSEAGF